MGDIQIKVGTTWTVVGGHTWRVIEKLPFGMFRVCRSDKGRIGEMSGKAIQAAIANAKVIQ
jgi:hypothetical protein